MTSRERIRTIVAGRAADRVGFWLGQPHRDTEPILLEAFGQRDLEGVRRLLADDVRWIPAGGYRHPEGRPMFDTGMDHARGLASGGAFADCEDVAEVEAFDWPDPDYLDFTETLRRLRGAGDVYRLSGFWCDFFHKVANFLGMEGYFIKMHTHPEVVHALTRRIVGFYLEANRRFYRQAGDLLDAFFLGNDFGTQRDLLISPAQFREFLLPYFRQLADQAHEHGYQVVLHSCGAVHKIIPDVIAIGVDGLHPLQARAADMDADTLARDFAGRIAFLGGIDTQELLVHGAPEDVRAEVRRVRERLGPCLVVSPSHEALLPNVPPANVRAMAEAAREP
jgi:uroporphyrinogen decarboxylase